MSPNCAAATAPASAVACARRDPRRVSPPQAALADARTESTRRTLATGWFVLTALAIGFAVYLSLDPDNYYFRHGSGGREGWAWRPLPVAIVCAAIAGEAAVLHAVWFARLSRAWKRALRALALVTPWVLLVSLVFMHMPRYVHLHIVWVWLVLAGLALTLLVDGVKALVARLRAGGTAP